MTESRLLATQPIGSTGLRTPKLALGCATFGREIDERAAFELMDYAVARGIRLFDTAEAYGGGQALRQLGVADHPPKVASDEMSSSEKIIGRWLKATGARGSVILQTKASGNYRPESVESSLAGSMERLQTDRIDLYLLHRYDPDVPLAETLAPIASAVRAGRVGAMGCSNFTLDNLRNAVSVCESFDFPSIEMVQPVYNLVARQIEGEFLSYCRERGIAVVSYSPLAAGFLSGKYLDGSVPAGSRFDIIPGHTGVYFSSQNFETARRLREFSERVGVPMVQLALAWALRNPLLTAVLVGGRSGKVIDNALDALALDLPDGWADEMNQWG